MLVIRCREESVGMLKAVQGFGVWSQLQYWKSR